MIPGLFFFDISKNTETEKKLSQKKILRTFGTIKLTDFTETTETNLVIYVLFLSVPLLLPSRRPSPTKALLSWLGGALRWHSTSRRHSRKLLRQTWSVIYALVLSVPLLLPSRRPSPTKALLSWLGGPFVDVSSSSAETTEINLVSNLCFGLVSSPAASFLPSLTNEGTFKLTRGPFVDTVCRWRGTARRMQQGNWRDQNINDWPSLSR